MEYEITDELDELFNEHIQEDNFMGNDDTFSFTDLDFDTSVKVLTAYIGTDNNIRRFNEYVKSLGDDYLDLIIYDKSQLEHNVRELYDCIGYFDYLTDEDVRELDYMAYNEIDTN